MTPDMAIQKIVKGYRRMERIIEWAKSTGIWNSGRRLAPQDAPMPPPLHGGSHQHVSAQATAGPSTAIHLAYTQRRMS